jgi:hypothetical protein
VSTVKFICAASAVLILFVLAPALLILWLHDKLWERKRKAWHERLLNPKPAEVEKLCGRLLPQRLISIYEDKDLITNGFSVHPPCEKSAEAPIMCIERFIPLTYNDQKEVRRSTRPGLECYFAEDVGIFFWVPVSETRQADAPVFLTGPDPSWGVTKIAASLDEFLSWPRTRWN